MDTSMKGLQASTETLKVEVIGKIDGIAGRLDEYEERFQQIEQHIERIDERHATLVGEMVEKEDAAKKTIEALTKRVVDLEEKVLALANVTTDIDDLVENVESRTNRQLRETLVFKNVPETEDDASDYDDTKKLLAEIISTHCDDVTYDQAFSEIKRAHRERDRPQDENPLARKVPSRKGKRLIYAAFHSWDLCQTVIKTFRLKCVKDPRFTISAEQKYGPITNKRRQMAFQLRRELIDSGAITSGYVDFPARLMVNLPGDYNGNKKVYKLHTNFSKHKI